MNCPNCNQEIPEGKKFCGHCGHKLVPREPVIHSPEPEGFDEQAPTIVDKSPIQPATDDIDESAPSIEPKSEVAPVVGQKACPSCGTQNPSGSRFCNACAADLTPEESPPDTVDAPILQDEVEEQLPEKSEETPKPDPPAEKRGIPRWVWAFGLLLIVGLIVVGILVVPRVISSEGASTETSAERLEPSPKVDVPAVSDSSEGESETTQFVEESQELPSVPSFVSEVLQNATISATEDFYTLPGDWHQSSSSINHDSANKIVFIPGSNNGIHLGAPYEIGEGEAILALFQFDKQGDVRTMLEAGTWETSTYRRWGMFSTVGNFRTDTYLGVDWRGEPILEGKIQAKPDTWYYLLLAVGPQGRFAMKVWERDDPSQSAQYWELDESQWENKKWSFLLSNWGGDVYLDSLSVIEFSALHDLSQAEIHFWAGKDYDREGNDQAALDEYSQAIALDDQVPHYFRRRGVMYWKLGEQDACITDHLTAIDVDPDNTSVLGNLSYFYKEQGDFDQAYYYADQLVNVAPDLHIGYWYMADAEMNVADDPQSAVIDYSLAIDRYSGDASLYRDRCIAYNALEEYALAKEDCTQCLEIDPNYDGCYWDRGWANDGLGDTSAAVSDFENYLEMVAPDVCPECQEDAQQYIDQNK